MLRFIHLSIPGGGTVTDQQWQTFLNAEYKQQFHEESVLRVAVPIKAKFE